VCHWAFVNWLCFGTTIKSCIDLGSLHVTYSSSIRSHHIFARGRWAHLFDDKSLSLHVFTFNEEDKARGSYSWWHFQLHHSIILVVLIVLYYALMTQLAFPYTAIN
jgi:hypothetical protein